MDKLTFTLFDDGLASDLFAESPTQLNDTRQFTVSLNTAAYTGDDSDVFRSLALKLSNGIDDFQQTAAPSGFTAQEGGLNNNGCDGAGGGFFCTQSSAGVLLDGSTYSWTFLVDPTGAFSASKEIKAQWFSATGTKLGQLSDKFGSGPVINPTDGGGGDAVPEPTTLLLLSSGLAGVLGAKRRRSA